MHILLATKSTHGTVSPVSNKESMGQFFTTSKDVQRVMVSLVTATSGLALEPSAGEGHLSAALEISKPGLSIESVELDSSLSWSMASHKRIDSDFFKHASGRDSTYRVIFGNPPYVALKNVSATSGSLIKDLTALYSGKTNLYHLFMHRCIDLLVPGGEIVFIVPGEWLYSTSASVLRAHMSKNGSLTHLIDCGEDKLFQDADVPSIVIFRFVKSLKQGSVRFWSSFDDAKEGRNPVKRELLVTGDRWLIADKSLVSQMKSWLPLSDMFDVKVGLVTGSDKCYALEDTQDVEEACVLEQLTSERSIKRFLYTDDFEKERDIPPKALKHLRKNKSDLLSRRIKRFDAGNWWKYGALRNLELMKSDRERFFANAKTRNPEPFFLHPTAKYFTGAVLGVFKKDSSAVSCSAAVKLLNSPKFRPVLDAMMLSSNGKISLQPATLADVLIPPSDDAIEQFLAS